MTYHAKLDQMYSDRQKQQTVRTELLYYKNTHVSEARGRPDLFKAGKVRYFTIFTLF